MASSQRTIVMDQVHPVATPPPDAALASSLPSLAARRLTVEGSGSLFGPDPFTSDTRAPERKITKRKQTLLALLDELAELRDEDLDRERELVNELTNDERTSSETAGMERFNAFDKRMGALDLKLQAFANAVRQLGSSAGLLHAAHHLRARLTQIQYYFQENAAELFDSVPHALNLGTQPYSARRGKARRNTSLGPKPTKPWSNKIEELPSQLDELAKDLHAFLDRLNDVPEFTDEGVNASIMAFEGDLRYRASCLREFDGQLKYAAVARYINDLTEDLGAHIDSVKDALENFIGVGVPTIQFSQKHTAAGLQNLSTVATFFSGVTATTLQFSFNAHGSPVQDLVNALWISSLVFSIASAINSQLAYHWRAAMYRSPRSYVPWWVSIWITQTPLVFLVGSVIIFSAGLCVFTYSSQQSPAVSAVITSFTGVTTFALLCVGLWFASERWTFARTKGSRWLLDIMDETSEKAGAATGITPAKKAAKRGAQRTQELFGGVKRSMTISSQHVVDVAGRMMSSLALMTDGSSTSEHRASDEEAQEGTPVFRTESPINVLDTDNGGGGLGVSGNREKRKLSDMGKGSTDPIPEDSPLVINAAPPTTSPPSAGESSNKDTATTTNEKSAGSPSESFTPKNTRFRAVVKKVMRLRAASSPNSPEPHRPMPFSSVMSEPGKRDLVEPQLIPSRIQTYVPMLRTLRYRQLLAEHVALVKHLQFSPDGRFLATCSWDRTALIWRVGSGPSDDFVVMHKLEAGIGGFVGQVAWSPSGDQLLTKQHRSIKLWNPKNGICQKTIDRKRYVQSVKWMPQDSGFVSVEWRMGNTSPQAEKRAHLMENIVGSDLVMIGTNGTEKQDYYLDRLQVWDAAFMPGEERIVAVATLLRSRQGLRPVKSRSEKRLLIYNLLTREIENQVPLLQEVRDITLTEEGNYALVSYENTAPPQAWRIDMIAREHKCRPVLAHTYLTKHPVDFAGPSYFGGVNDTFVLAASKGGEIYIWERASGVLLHSVKAPDQELTNIAWNHKSPDGGFMFASAAHDGMVRIWTAPTTEPQFRSPVPSPGLAEGESPSLIGGEFPQTGQPFNDQSGGD